MIITIGGLAGTGTSTVASILSQKMGIPCLSAGDIFRQMAAMRGMDVLDFSKFAEGNTDIDREIDQRQAQNSMPQAWPRS
jgi:cytidylate kinase